MTPLASPDFGRSSFFLAPRRPRMSAGVTTSPALPIWRDPRAWIRSADVFVILTALALPWSTSLVAIFAVAWLLTLVPTLDIGSFLPALKRPNESIFIRCIAYGG